MRKILLIGLFVLSICAKCMAENANEGKTDSKTFNWEPLIAALMTVESNNNPNATSGRSAGILQITPIFVKECNQILERRGLKGKKKFTLKDRFDVGKSKEMFLLFQSYFNPKNNVEYAIRSWKGGINYTVKSTQHYYEKVMRVYKP